MLHMRIVWAMMRCDDRGCEVIYSMMEESGKVRPNEETKK